MGTFLATVVLAVPLINGFRGTSFLEFLNTVWRGRPPRPAEITPVPGNPMLLQPPVRTGRMR
ncbi:MAG: hypothetical protein DMG42_13675 [Acidobacteria bacterium]|nr:MAG: hypothetical protein DMG42_13675 [Acidobacteriota bacterium]